MVPCTASLRRTTGPRPLPRCTTSLCCLPAPHCCTAWLPRIAIIYRKLRRPTASREHHGHCTQLQPTTVPHRCPGPPPVARYTTSLRRMAARDHCAASLHCMTAPTHYPVAGRCDRSAEPLPHKSITSTAHSCLKPIISIAALYHCAVTLYGMTRRRYTKDLRHAAAAGRGSRGAHSPLLAVASPLLLLRRCYLDSS